MRVLTHVGGDVAERLRQTFPEVEFVEIPSDRELPPGLTGDALFTSAFGSQNLGHVLERGVRWVHTLGTGVDRFPLGAIDDQILTCSRGASAIPISEWVLAVMLAFEKRLPDSWIFDVPEHWHLSRSSGVSTAGSSGSSGSAASAVRSRTARCRSGCACSATAVPRHLRRGPTSRWCPTCTSCSRGPTTWCCVRRRPRRRVTSSMPQHSR